MKFSEAMLLLEQGKKVKPKYWQNKYVYIHEPETWENLKRYNLFALMFGESGEWEVYEEPVQLLSFSEVVKGLKEGKKFKRTDWENHQEIIVSYGEIFRATLERFVPLLEDFEANDWVQCD